MQRNLILRTDSYKYSHGGFQYPPGTTGMQSYLESRGGRYGRTVFFGLQAYLIEYLEGCRVGKVHVDEAAAFCEEHGVPFNKLGWVHVLRDHNGRIPVRIRAVPEGAVVPTHNVLMTVEATNPELYWLPSFLETQLVRAVWYPTTVATVSWHCKKILKEYLDETSDDPEGELPFKLHDFGGRGVSSGESAEIGDMGHLVNFKGSDTVEGILAARRYYGEHMAAYSIPAMEHSTVTTWGEAGELAAYANMLDQFAKPGAVLACVSDSYDVWRAIERYWCGELRQRVEDSGATVVIRLDSGDAVETVPKALRAMERHVGMRKNLKGYKVLPKCWRLLQGDGVVDEEAIGQILGAMKLQGYSASNIAFGMGGGLLQQLDRDTQRFAMKCSWARVNGEERDVYKRPVDAPDKASRPGRLDLVRDGDGYRTVAEDAMRPQRSELVTVFEDGEIKSRTTLADVRARAARGLR